MLKSICTYIQGFLITFTIKSNINVKHPVRGFLKKAYYNYINYVESTAYLNNIHNINKIGIMRKKYNKVKLQKSTRLSVTGGKLNQENCA